MLKWLLASLITTMIFSCQQATEKHLPSNNSADIDVSTQQMVDSIQAIYGRTEFRQHPYEYTRKLKLIEEEIKALEGKLMPNQVLEYARTQLNVGKPQNATITLYKLIQIISKRGEGVEEGIKEHYEMLGISFLRQAEQENCIENHSDESCIMPIQGKGIHIKTEGSTNAIEMYKKILSSFPNDLQSRWLLNIAYMTLGKYPGEVPKEFLIPNLDSKQPDDFPHFKNVAVDLGLDINELAGGVIAEDFDNDGFIDLMITSWGMLDQIYFFKNNGDGTFSNQTETCGLKGITGGLNLTQGDFNNDGFVDFVVLRGGWKYNEDWGILPNSLIQNNGDGTFTDVTIAAGMYSTRPCKTAVWMDFDADGWLDLFVGNESIEGKSRFPCELYANNGDGTFTDVAPKIGMDIVTYSKGVSSGDINNDGLPDIYISSLTSDNLLYANRGGTNWEDWRFEEIGAKAGVLKPLNSFPSWFCDFNNDGMEDIFVFPFSEQAYRNQSGETAADYLGLKFESLPPAVYQNNGDETFTNVTREMGLNKVLHTMGCNYGDLDNDGYLDFYLGTGAPDYRAIVPNRMFRNQQGKSFEDVTGAGSFGHLQKGHGIAFADFDNDGDQDVYSVMGGSFTGDNAQNVFFENPGNQNSWIQIQLEGTKTNRSAIGSKIILTISTSTGTQRKIYNTVSDGASFGCNSLRQEIGLGNAKKIDELEVIWANGSKESIRYGAVGMNQMVKIVEGTKEVKPVKLQQVQFQASKGNHQHVH
ncbi:MAG: CRTAC1 family protein [Chitinophagales bacterium]